MWAGPPSVILWLTADLTGLPVPTVVTWHFSHSSLGVLTASYSMLIGFSQAIPSVATPLSITWQVSQGIPTHSSSGMNGLPSACLISGSAGNLQEKQDGGGPMKDSGSQFCGEWQREHQVLGPFPSPYVLPCGLPSQAARIVD